MRASWFSVLLAISTGALAGCGQPEPACTGLSFPAPPSDVSDPVFVAAPCPALNADGSRERPYPRLADALAHAAAGSTLLVAADTEYDEGLVIDKAVRILAAPPDTAAEDATVTLRPPDNSGVRLVAGAHDVYLRGLIIERAKAAGVWVPGNTSATMDGVLVSNTESDGDGAHGYGVLASDGGSIQILRSTVKVAPEVGIYIAGGAASIENSEVDDVSGHGGIRLEAALGTVAIKNSIVDQCTEVGILVANSTVTIENTAVLRTRAGASGIGDGIVVRRRADAKGAYFAEASATISKTVVTQSARLGVLFSEGATGTLTEDTIASNGANAELGAGIWLQSGAGGEAGVLIEQSTIHMNSFVGIGVTSLASARIENNPQISDTVLGIIPLGIDQLVEIGDGIGVFAGARANIVSNTITRNGRFGVLLDDVAAATTLKSNEISENMQFGLVIQHGTMGIPAFADNTFENNLFGPTAVFGQAETAFDFRSGDFSTP
jgi:parallel beta-helix repeat protein